MEKFYYACDKNFHKTNISDCYYLLVFDPKEFIKEFGDKYIMDGIEENFVDGGTVYYWTDWYGGEWMPVGKESIHNQVFDSFYNEGADFYSILIDSYDSNGFDTLATFKNKREAEKWVKIYRLKNKFKGEMRIVPQKWGEYSVKI